MSPSHAIHIHATRSVALGQVTPILGTKLSCGGSSLLSVATRAGNWTALLWGAMASDASVSEGSKLKSAQLLDMVRTHLTTDAGKELQKKIGFVYQINIAPKKIGFEEEVFVVDLKNLKVYKGKAEGKPDATFSFVDSDFISVASGKTNPQMAFIRGKMKIKGSMSAAQKFTPDIFPKPAKL